MARAIADAALRMLAIGLHPLPLVPGQKRPVWTGWQEYDVHDREKYRNDLMRDLRPDSNLGVRCDNLVIVDEDNEAAGPYWAERLGPIYATSVAWMSKKGKKTAFVLPPNTKVQAWASKGELDFDIKSGSGHQVVVPPSIVAGHPYEWVRRG